MKIDRVIQIAEELKKLWAELKQITNEDEIGDLDGSPRPAKQRFNSKTENNRVDRDRAERKRIQTGMMELFRDNPDRGFSSKDLYRRFSQRSKSTVHRQLTYLYKSGLIERPSSRSWRLRKEDKIVVEDKTQATNGHNENGASKYEAIILRVLKNKPMTVDAIRKNGGVGYYKARETAEKMAKQNLIQSFKKNGSQYYAPLSYQQD